MLSLGAGTSESFGRLHFQCFTKLIYANFKKNAENGIGIGKLWWPEEVRNLSVLTPWVVERRNLSLRVRFAIGMCVISAQLEGMWRQKR